MMRISGSAVNRIGSSLLVLLALVSCAGSQSAPPASGGGRALVVNGQLSPGLDYRLLAEWATTSKQSACQHADYITGMPMALRQRSVLSPERRDGQHELAVPVVPPALLLQRDDCEWQLQSVSVCPQTDAGTELGRCQALLIIKPNAGGLPARLTVACGREDHQCDGVDGVPLRHAVALPARGSRLVLDLHWRD